MAGAHSPGSALLSPESVGQDLGELVRVSTVFAPREECAQLRAHVAEDEGQLGQLSPARLGSEDLELTLGPPLTPPPSGQNTHRGEAPRICLRCQCRIKVDSKTACCSPDASPLRTSVSPSVKEREVPPNIQGILRQINPSLCLKP